MESERWRPAVGFEGLYEVSDTGQVRSLTRTITCADGPKTFRGRSISPAVCIKTGYAKVCLYIKGKRVTRPVHALVAEAFVGRRPDGADCRHINGDKSDNRPINLCWGTRQENMNDARRHGTLSIGEKRPNAALTDEAVKAIRARKKTGEKSPSIAADYGLSKDHISAVARGRFWKHVL